MNERWISAALMIAASVALPAQATNIAITANGAWNEFTVDNQVAPAFGTGWIDFVDGSPLTFSFNVGAGTLGRLTVVDAGFAGDTFAVTNFGAALGPTSSVAVGTTAGPVVFDFDAALANPSFSRAVLTLAPGSYRIGGALLQSVLDAGVALNATNGAVSLVTVAAPVPEPATAPLLLLGLSAAGMWSRARSNR